MALFCFCGNSCISLLSRKLEGYLKFLETQKLACKFLRCISSVPRFSTRSAKKREFQFQWNIIHRISAEAQDKSVNKFFLQQWIPYAAFISDAQIFLHKKFSHIHFSGSVFLRTTFFGKFIMLILWSFCFTNENITKLYSVNCKKNSTHQLRINYP